MNGNRNLSLVEMPTIPEPVRMITNKMDAGLPIPDLISYYVLENDRKLYLDEEVDMSVMNKQRMILRWNMEDVGKPVTERKPIHLYIFSPGGDTDAMWSMIDTILASETPVITVNMGLAASAAGLIFLAGHRRLMMPRSKLLIHEGSARMSGDAVKVIDAGESYKKNVKQMKDFILERTRISAQTLSRQSCHDWELNAEYCLDHGVCDAIVTRLSEVI